MSWVVVRVHEMAWPSLWLWRKLSFLAGYVMNTLLYMILTIIKALVWFATHFKDLATIMGERAGVQNLQLAVEVCSAAHEKLI